MRQIMIVERIVKVAAQVIALALLATSSPLAQKAAEAPRAAKSKPAAAGIAKSARNGATDATPVGTPVARLRGVVGNVLVSGESGLSSAEGSVALLQGSRVITTAEAKAVVVYRDGCAVTLGANERLEIENDLPCGERIRLAQSIFLQPGGLALAAGAAGAAGGATAAVLGGALPAAGLAAGTVGLAGLATLAANRDDNPVSPN
jgi:hypothetical protein